jgi:hypothetical protein
VLATLALLAVAAAMYTMVASVGDATPAPGPAAPAAKPAASKPTGPTPAQLKARREAVAYLRAEGYVAVRKADYRPAAALHVLLGRRDGVPAGSRRAFFFAGGRFIGYDAGVPTIGLKVAGAGRRWVSLSYGASTVRFELRDGALHRGG